MCISATIVKSSILKSASFKYILFSNIYLEGPRVWLVHENNIIKANILNCIDSFFVCNNLKNPIGIFYRSSVEVVWGF